ncbi:MAG: phosphodiesterase, partial [Lachnospiraceae bacterium]|nr:phosphodiesterase [Lachnospiraceae bacterium]
IEDYPTIMECLVRMPSIEPRALNLFVKPELRQHFEEEFNKFFGDCFILMTKQEVTESRLFGTGTDHACFRDMLGDYLAVAVGDTTIFNTREEQEKFIGVHAGLTKDEMTIPLIIMVIPK